MILHHSEGRRNFLQSPIPLHRRGRWEVFAVHHGHFGLLIQGKARPIYNTKPTVWLLPPQTEHGKTGDGSSCDVALFVVDQMPAIVEHALSSEDYLQFTLSDTQMEQYLSLHQQIEPLHKDRDPMFPLRESLLLNQLLLLLFESLPKHRQPFIRSPDKERLESAFLWFREHMKQGPTLTDIAKAVHLSESHFRKLVRQHYSKSAHGVLLDIRMERAMGLLLMGKLTIESIAHSCGFGSSAAFSRAFKRHTKSSPQKFKSRHSFPRSEGTTRRG